MPSALNYLLLGAIAMGTLTAGIFFLRFWRTSRDRLFLLFGLSFLVESVNRVALALTDRPNEGSPWYYCVRLLSFLLILVAIVDKNRVSSSPKLRRATMDPSMRP